jgi:hypothetical protein
MESSQPSPTCDNDDVNLRPSPPGSSKKSDANDGNESSSSTAAAVGSGITNNRQSAMPSMPSSRGAVVAVPSERIRRRSVAVNGSKNTRDIIQKVPNILRASNTVYENVTDEQIERIRTIHKTIEAGAKFTFNYNTLLVVASILAELGLVSNSNTTAIASILVSPIMGPVVGMVKYKQQIRG